MSKIAYVLGERRPKGRVGRSLSRDVEFGMLLELGWKEERRPDWLRLLYVVELKDQAIPMVIGAVPEDTSRGIRWRLSRSIC